MLNKHLTWLVFFQQREQPVGRHRQHSPRLITKTEGMQVLSSPRTLEQNPEIDLVKCWEFTSFYRPNG